MRKTVVYGMGVLLIAALVVHYWMWVVSAIVITTAWSAWRKHAAKMRLAREKARREIENLSARADAGDRDWAEGGSGIPGFEFRGGMLVPISSEIAPGKAKHRR